MRTKDRVVRAPTPQVVEASAFEYPNLISFEEERARSPGVRTEAPELSDGCASAAKDVEIMDDIDSILKYSASLRDGINADITKSPRLNMADLSARLATRTPSPIRDGTYVDRTPERGVDRNSNDIAVVRTPERSGNPTPAFQQSPSHEKSTQVNFQNQAVPSSIVSPKLENKSVAIMTEERVSPTRVLVEKNTQYERRVSPLRSIENVVPFRRDGMFAMDAYREELQIRKGGRARGDGESTLSKTLAWASSLKEPFEIARQPGSMLSKLSAIDDGDSDDESCSLSMSSILGEKHLDRIFRKEKLRKDDVTGAGRKADVRNTKSSISWLDDFREKAADESDSDGSDSEFSLILPIRSRFSEESSGLKIKREAGKEKRVVAKQDKPIEVEDIKASSSRFYRAGIAKPRWKDLSEDAMSSLSSLQAQIEKRKLARNRPAASEGKQEMDSNVDRMTKIFFDM
ncbi:hypothetical protein BC829DRAFT_227731 [Chytridium lagenaria]|nr:hypothetical protein BC829DRAFT_227731 [Chytridium lagenaria]